MTFLRQSSSLTSLASPSRLPSLWAEFLDHDIPPFVKARFSPKDTWKDKPFTKTDLTFFSRGLIELSDFFTVEREGTRLPAYFTNGRYRSSYFLYFFALQGAKFLSLYDRFPAAIDTLVEDAKKKQMLRIIDVGSGPGTASIALLIFLLESKHKETILNLPKIELLWIDRNKTIQDDGLMLLKRFLERKKLLPDSVKVIRETRDWWKHPKDFDGSASIVLFGNVLNEGQSDKSIFFKGLKPFLSPPQGAGVLFVEPAFKTASQRLSQIRDEWLLGTKHGVWGPCLHHQKCPLAEGRDWCHFSIPAELPGRWFRQFSIQLGGIREWLKFSMLWISAPESASRLPAVQVQPNPKKPPEWYRVLSDPMQTKQGKKNQLCAPEKIIWIDTTSPPLHRGALSGGPT